MEVTFIDAMGGDLSVVNAARVSFDKESSWEGGSHPDFDPDKKLSERGCKVDLLLGKARSLVALCAHVNITAYQSPYLCGTPVS